MKATVKVNEREESVCHLTQILTTRKGNPNEP